MLAKLELDHLVVVAPNLEQGVEHVYEALGVRMPVGGRHPFMGTHNHVMQLGPEAFLEVIAIDPQATAPTHPRWFGLDDFAGDVPQLGLWVARANSISLVKPHIPVDHRRFIPMSRPTADGLLEWEISVAENGRLPFEGAYPTILEWPEGKTPIHQMANLGCGLASFEIAHPQADEISAHLKPVFEDERVKVVQADDKKLSAVIMTRDGPKNLT